MKRILTVVSAVLYWIALQQGACGQEQTAFPGAVGFGVGTPGGRGGQVIRVTRLNAEGPGSLRAALDTEGPRIVVFEVGGVIDLQGKGLGIGQPFITVAGETAPSPGITIIRGGIGIPSHDVVLRHLRIRPGDNGRPKRSGWEPDGICAYGSDAYNVVIDHCSVSWAVDENISTSGARTEGPEATARKVTISNCIIAEGLDNATHTKGRHSKGSLIHDFCRDIAIIGNLYAHNARRNPYFKAHCTGVVVNNLIYNPQSTAIQAGFVPSEWRSARMKPVAPRIGAVGNVMIHGTDTRKKLALIAGRGDVYCEDNMALDAYGNAAALTHGHITLLEKRPVWPKLLEPVPARDVPEHVLRHAGARPRDRDAVDRRILADVRARRGRIIDSQEDVGGYPTVPMTRRALDVPETGIDAWLWTFAEDVE